MNEDLTGSRFVVLRHEAGSKLARTSDSHFDWMFEVDGTLRTWSTPPPEGFEHMIELPCQLLDDHRLAYLDYEGELGGGRGRVARVLAGDFCLLEDGGDRFSAGLFWDEASGRRAARVTIYRSLSGEGLPVDESRESWRLRFSPG